MRALPFLLVPALALAACSGPEVYEAETIRFEGEDRDADDPAVRDVRVEVKSWLEDEDVLVKDLVGRVLDGRPAAQFSLLIEEDEPVRVLCTWEWRDADGIALRSAASEVQRRYLVLRPRQVETLSFTAPSELALRFYASIEPTYEQD
jgi:uncharacterized protein YcfL